MESFGKKVEAGWVSVLRSGATPIEELDAPSWVNVNALDKFSDEFRIQLAWMRQSLPDIPNPGWLYTTRLRQMKSLLSTWIRSTPIRIDAPSSAMLARCVMGLWMPRKHSARRRQTCGAGTCPGHRLARGRRSQRLRTPIFLPNLEPNICSK